MGANKGEKWNAIACLLSKEYRSSHALEVAYEALRISYLKVGGTANGDIPSTKALEIAKEMQDLEAKIAAVWKPHQKLIGACPKCKDVRIPGTMPEGYGFGCVTCHDFEIFVSHAA